jgi:hypothetical protein
LDLIFGHQRARRGAARGLELDFVRARGREPRAAHDADFTAAQAKFREVLEQSDRRVHRRGWHESLLLMSRARRRVAALVRQIRDGSFNIAALARR